MYELMDAASAAWLSGFVAGVCFLLTTYRTEFAFNIPYHFSALTLALSGVSILATVFLVQRYSPRQDPPYHESLIPLVQSPPSSPTRIHSPARQVKRRYSVTTGTGYMPPRQLRSLLLFLILALCVRVEFARWVITHTQCARHNLTPFIPIALTIFDLYARPVDPRDFSNDPDDSDKYVNRVIHSRWRYIIPMSIMTLGASCLYGAFPRPRSTFICAQASPYPTSIPFLQVAGTVLDIVIAVSVHRVLYRGRSNDVVPPSKNLKPLGWASLISASVFTFFGFLVYYFLPFYRYRIYEMPGVYIFSAFKLAIVIAFTSVCALQTLRRLGFPPMLFLALFFGANMSSFQAARSSPGGFPPVSHAKIMYSLFLINAGAWAYVWTEGMHSAHNAPQSPSKIKRVPKRLTLSLFALLMIQAAVWFSGKSLDSKVHPVDFLISNAEVQYRDWAAHASPSKNVSDAAQIYKDRYGRTPPPRFDLWFDYARLQKSVVLDEFDSIHDDLLPFWSLEPAKIRELTWEAIANPWNTIGGVSIRSGQIEIVTEVADSHRWILEGVKMMIHPFSKWLPDMDLAFNLNDESRVAVHLASIEAMREQGRQAFRSDGTKTRDYSVERATLWNIMPDPAKPYTESRFQDHSFLNTYHTFGTVGCPNNSKAKKERQWHVRDTCTACKSPHALDQFLSNWTTAADPCHQPDLADLHGFYSSPSEFKATNDLMPVFSQSKAQGYNDIRYPSPWNYLDRTIYRPEEAEPAWKQKEPTLFWRGGTSEGKLLGSGAWKGMTRQRLVHMVNNSTVTDAPLVLLADTPYVSSAVSAKNSDKRKRDAQGPGPEDTGDQQPVNPPLQQQLPQQPQKPSDPVVTYSYKYMSPDILHQHLSTDIHLVRAIDRCTDPDCGVQYFEFQPQNIAPVPFQSHWRYKYLFDLDGAGFSGRFLPFLQSRSLPFKASLMREWWDSRVFPWKHFVPVDLRLDETWSLLAYFAGWKVEEGIDGWTGRGGTKWLMRPHEEEAERIALEGRKWAAKALRKEDMEVYLFRLLLEWGRLTDEKRDELGWNGEEAKSRIP